jgi:prophage antirepressor-like protein
MTATSNFQIFDFKDQSVRVIPGAEPRFVHNDLCRILVLTNPREALRRLDPDDVSQTDIIDAMGRPQKVNVVSEAGMYELILRSDKPGCPRIQALGHARSASFAAQDRPLRHERLWPGLPAAARSRDSAR